MAPHYTAEATTPIGVLWVQHPYHRPHRRALRPGWTGDKASAYTFVTRAQADEWMKLAKMDHDRVRIIEIER